MSDVLTKPENFTERAEALSKLPAVRRDPCAHCRHSTTFWKRIVCSHHGRTRKLECYDDNKQPQFEMREVA